MGEETVLDSQEKTGAEGEGGSTFHDSLGDLKGNEIFKDITSTEQLGSSYAELVKNHEELKSSQPVVPETAEAYKFTAPEGVDLNDEGVKSLAEVAHKLKLSNEAAQELLSFDINRKAAEAEKQAAKATEAETAMKTEFGGDYETNLAKAKKVLNAFDGENILSIPDGKGDFLGNNPALFKFLVNVAGKISEDTLEEAKLGGGEKKSIGDTLFDHESNKA